MNISFLVTIAMLGIPFYGHGWSSTFIGIIVLAALGIYLFAKLDKNTKSVHARSIPLCFAS